MKKVLTGVVVAGMMAVSGAVSANNQTKLYVNSKGQEFLIEQEPHITSPVLVKADGMRWTRTNSNHNGDVSWAAYYNPIKDKSIVFCYSRGFLVYYQGTVSNGNVCSSGSFVGEGFYFYQGVL